MNGFDFLWQYRNAKNRIAQLEIKERHLLDIATSTPDVEMTVINGERVILPKTGRVNAKHENADKKIIEMIALGEEIQREKRELFDVMKNVTKVIDSIETNNSNLTEVYKRELYHYFIDGDDWQTTADKVGYTTKSIYNRHLNIAVKAVEDVLKSVDLNGLREGDIL